jgi:L-ectoine synthase
MSETTADAGREMSLWYKHHQEACFVIEGEAIITERETGTTHRIGPGDAYAPGNERHAIRVIEPLRLVCVFNPALTGQETHDADGSYAASDG